jgi:hypothetical protein
MWPANGADTEKTAQLGPSLREKPLVECRLDLEFVDGFPDRRTMRGSPI